MACVNRILILTEKQVFLMKSFKLFNNICGWIAFAIATVQLLRYDLVIMDEFQNFSDIIQGANRNANQKNYLRRQREIIR